MGAINSRDEPSWLVAAVSERLSSSTLLLLLHSLPQAAPPGQHLPLHLPKSLTNGSFSCHQSLVLQRLMVRYSWWRGSLGITFMAPNTQYLWSSILHWDPMDWGWRHDKLVSPLSTFPGHPGFITFIKLLLSSCLSMYNIQSSLSSTFRGLCMCCVTIDAIIQNRYVGKIHTY